MVMFFRLGAWARFLLNTMNAVSCILHERVIIVKTKVDIDIC